MSLRILFFTILCLFISVDLVAKEKKIDNIALAALLLKGGDYIKAEKALDKVNLDEKDLDLARFYTIKGLVKLRLQQYQEAINSYKRAQSHGQQDKSVYIYLAQSYYGLKQFSNVLENLQIAQALWLENPRVWLLKSLSYHALKDFNNTMSTLIAAEKQFPEEKQFTQRKILLFVELGLYQQAVETGMEMLERDNIEIIDYQTIGKAMIEAGQYSHALPILEKAVLHYPNDIKLLRTLSRTYVLKGQYYVAASILEKAASQDESLLSEVSELYRKAKKSEQSLYFNQIVPDQKKKYKQRLAIYLDDGRFDEAIGMRNTLYRVGLLDEGSIRYALAYAYFSVGKYRKTEEFLDGIRQPDLFRKATQLRKAMLACKKIPAQCL